MNKVIALILTLLIFSCREKDSSTANLKEIKIDKFAENSVVNFKKYFDSSKVIPLETSAASLIGDIHRISIYKQRIYILDRTTNSIFVFNDTGKFIFKIHNIGSDEGKFIGLMDFSIDEISKRLVLHSHQPYKLIYYSLDGKYISEKTLDFFYKNISSVSKDSLLTINADRDKLASLIDLNDNNNIGYIDKSDVSEKFNFFSTVFPNVIKSKNIYITFPFTSIIYKYENNQINPAYKINFGGKNVPDSLLKNKNLKASQIYNTAMKNDLGFFITNFRETKKYIFFSYGKGNIVIHSKENGKTESFNYVRNEEDLIDFENLFAHDGNDDYMIATRQAPHFKVQMAYYRGDPKSWRKIPDYIKKIDSTLTNNSNPVLILYKLKSK